jgi:hypothetical protein
MTADSVATSVHGEQNGEEVDERRPGNAQDACAREDEDNGDRVSVLGLALLALAVFFVSFPDFAVRR